ncbi:Remorin like [Actinidia chinensis var. chinensis]|uniref:Remorin like n=1 Tax=Actinidia chinensis var. chinensis TaxID=1590841 RepID=A0A2R6PT32_ACTCC|nr:Remorin like [Actinidia chinensis var. chinensis]
MDLTSSNYVEAPSFLVSNGDNPFADTFPDPICKLNLKETSEFVKSFPMANLDVSAQRRREGVSSITKRANNVEAPPTPGRPIFSFSVGNLARKSFPSKWDDAEKWLNGSSSCHDSPAHQHHHHGLKPSESSRITKQCEEFKPQAEVFAEKSRVIEEKVSKSIPISSIQGSLVLKHHISDRAFNGVSASSGVLLKDKFTKEVEPISPKFRCSEPMKEGFLFGNSEEKSMTDAKTEVAREVKEHRDVGTEMTPLGSSTTSRCHTPFKSTSPVRHNTPENRSGPLALINSNCTNKTIDITQLQECHLAKLNIGSQFDSVISTWSSREEEEEDISKSLRHFEIGSECRKIASETRACTWEEEQKNKCCLRYQREEAKIQAWVNLQSARAEAQSRKLEVKIEKMRSNLEEKWMKRMGVVHRKAEEWRAVAQLQHTQQIHKATKQANLNQQNLHFSGQISSCGCFPCNHHHV